MNSPFMNDSKLTSHPFLAIRPTEEDSDQSVQDEDSENDEGDDQEEEDGVYYVDKILQTRVNGQVCLCNYYKGDLLNVSIFSRTGSRPLSSNRI